MVYTMSAFTIFTSCSNKEPSEPIGKGNLRLNLGITVTESSVSKLKSGLSTDDFRVKIYNSNDVLIEEFANATDIPSTLELAAGSYYAVANSDNEVDASFENPYYEGNSGTFVITTGQTTTADVTCTLANIMVTVTYSAQVISSFSDFSTTVSNSSSNLIFAKTETRAGYFSSGPLQLVTTLTYSLNNVTKTKTLTGSIPGAQAGKHYQVNIDASITSGGALVNILLDETVSTEVISINDNTPVDNTPVYGDLLISEIMYHPLTLGDPAGEWIEIYNNSAKSINLKDMVLRKATATTFHKIATDVNMTPGSFVVLAKSATSTSNVAYVYGSGLSLTNSGMEVIVATFGTTGHD